jgi:hypothetical protein
MTGWLAVIHNVILTMADEILRWNELICREILHTAGVAKLLLLVIAWRERIYGRLRKNRLNSRCEWKKLGYK